MTRRLPSLMAFFDISKNWIILAPPLCRTQAARDFAHIISKLREEAGFAPSAPVIIDSVNSAPDGASEIVFNCDAGSKKNSFAWRAAEERIEIYGHSIRSFDNALFDFLGKLGVSCGLNGEFVLPQKHNGGLFPLEKSNFYTHHSEEPRRLFIGAKRNFNEARSLLFYAGRTQIDEVVFSLKPEIKTSEEQALLAIAGRYHLAVGRGGYELSMLVPRKLFLFHRSLFRMESGKRKKDANFCASNHKTLEVLKKNAAFYFEKYKGTKNYYLFPDGGAEQRFWCSCPACRAFSFKEQNLMALCAAASVLAKIDGEARLFCGGVNSGESALSSLTNMIYIQEKIDIY
ncbi:MAG: hypothetical protein Pg6A_16660 [Termitinemataceae bacterium]|nr:MAG: hypothetical protein Pg6A_16660 [Termitinemataceae bacterium]